MFSSIKFDKIVTMQANEQESDSIISLPKDDSMISSDIKNSETISESSACNEQSTEKLRAENMSESSPNETDTCKESGFKKPLLLIEPKRSKIEKSHIVNDNVTLSSSESLSINNGVIKTLDLQKDDSKDKADNSILENSVEKNVLSDAKNIPVYLEPKWGGKPTEEYKLEVLKSGVILEKIDLTKRSFYLLGRLPSCNLTLAHPTISRYHAIIQYRMMEDDKNSKGFYLYDLESTHGTFWNGHRIKPRTYVRLHDGHIIKLGGSQRKYILQAPNDQEEESELSVTQLKVCNFYLYVINCHNK